LSDGSIEPDAAVLDEVLDLVVVERAPASVVIGLLWTAHLLATAGCSPNKPVDDSSARVTAAIAYAKRQSIFFLANWIPAYILHTTRN
jgi:hypothetical protein